jgi:N-acetylglucosaminyl-diphospho-decaprenol L-rhamnosyltransferase
VTGVSVAIVSFNTREELASCLSALFQRTKLRPLDVIVADNASTDGSLEMLEERFPEVRTIRCGANLGFAKASNRCWREASQNLVLFLNSDAIVSEDAVDRMAAVMEGRERVGAVGPLLRNEDGTIQVSFGRMHGLVSEFLQKCLNRGYAEGKGPLRGYITRLYADERNPDWVSGACLMTRRDLLEQVGGFDENFFLYSEDVDLCARLRAIGATIVFTPRAEVTHLRGRSTARNTEKTIFESHRSRLYFYSKHFGRRRLLLLKSYLRVKLELACLFQPQHRETYRSLIRLARDFQP